MYERVKQGWAKASKDFSGKPAFWERSALVMLLRRAVEENLKKYGKGRILDAGAGTLTYRPLVKRYADDYYSVDFKQTHPELDQVSDIQEMQLSDNSFDTVLCVEVLEHVPYPAKALSEIYRVLKPGGHLILTVPHMGYLHNEPHDYYRYTKYGLRVLLEDAGFEVQSIEANGGFVSFVQHMPATFLVGITFGIPGVQQVSHAFNRVTSHWAIWIDDKVDKKKLFAVHYAAVAKKPEHEPRT